MRPRLNPIAAGLLAACLPLLAAGQDNAAADNSAIGTLVQQGQYWQGRNNVERSNEAWQKLLRIDPNQPDALFGLGIDAVKANKFGDANKYLDRLRALDANSMYSQRLNQAIVLGTGPGKKALEDARLAVQSNDLNGALAKYREAFKNVPTPHGDIALEYYSRLGYLPGSRAEALSNLERLAKEDPSNNEIRLNIAQVTALDENTRTQGIRQLQQLSTLRDVGGAATESWREALGYLGHPPRAADKPLFEAYLKDHPDDDEIKQQYASIGKAPPPTAAAAAGSAGAATATAAAEKPAAPAPAPVDPLRARTDAGLQAMSPGNIPIAENDFTTVLKSKPNYADALGGMGIVRMRQQRFDDARSYLERAVKAGGTKWREALGSATYWSLVGRANAARSAGDLATADKLLRQANAAMPDDPAAAVQLAAVQADRGQFGAAESSYRSVLQRTPNDADALRGLVSVLARTGRAPQAQRMLDSLTPAQRTAIGNMAPLRAAIYAGAAKDALAQGDSATAQQALEQAVREDPNDPWTRVDLARLYLKTGDKSRAEAVMTAFTSSRPNDYQGLYASALVYAEAKDYDNALATLQRIPQAARTPDMTLLERRTYVSSQAALATRLARQGRRNEAMGVLQQAGAYAGQDPDMVGTLALAYVDAGAAPTGAAMLRNMLASQGSNPSAAAQLQYASFLLKTNQADALVAALRNLQQMPMGSAEQASFDNLRVLYIAQQAEALRQRNDLVAAYDTLAPVLQERPNDPLVQGTLARMYVSAGEYPKALALYTQLQQNDPGDVDVQLGAAQAANQIKDYSYADKSVEKALALAPDNPEVLTTAARIYRDQGKVGKATDLFKRAVAAQQAGSAGTPSPQLASAAPAASNPFVGLPGQRSQSTAGPGAVPIAVPAALAGAAVATAGAPPQAAYIPPPANSVRPPAPLPPASTAPQYASAGPAAGYVPPPAYAQGDAYAANGGYAPPPPAYRQTPVPDNGAPYGYAAQPQQPPVAVASAAPTAQQELDQLLRGRTPQVQVGLSGRNRNGESGLGQLTDVDTPMEGRAPAGDGNVTVRVTPTLLDAGAVSKSYGAGSRFGGGPVAALDQQAGTVGSAGSQLQRGVGLSVGYEQQGFSGDIGTTPLGFQYSNVVGGVKFSGPLNANGLSYEASLSRRAVTDSLLSFAGTRDARTGQSWGGVTATGVRGQVTQDYGDYGVYGYGSYQWLDGHNVASNTRVEAGVGLYKYLLRDTDYQLTSGVNLMGMGYDKNLSNFTYGQGGYFSPQNYFAISVPLTWAQRQGALSYQVKGSLGLQHFNTSSSPYFPTNGSLQNAANAAMAQAFAQGLTDTSDARYSGQSKTGVGYSLAANAEYQVGQRLYLGGMTSIDNARDYRQWVAGIYARYTFDALSGPMNLPVTPFVPPYTPTTP